MSAKRSSKVPEAPVEEVIKRLEAGDPSLVLLDTRAVEERSVSTIAGSISKEEFEKSPEAYADKEIVTFCTVGYLAGAYACELSRVKGFKNVRNLGDGSLLGWTLAGKGIVKPEDGSAADTVHTFLAGLNGLAGDGLKTTNYSEDDANARLTKANEHIKEALGL